MVANKGKKGKTKKGAPGRKSRLWLRDLLNILGGLLVGSLGFWTLQEYLGSRTAKEVVHRYVKLIEIDLPALKQAAERYEALSEHPDEPSRALEGLDINGTLHNVDAYRRVQQDFPDLDSSVRPLLLAFYFDLRDAELLRKLLVEQKEHPEQISQILAREFLRALYEGTQRAPRLLWALGKGKEAEGS